METEEKMHIAERYKYLRIMQGRYRQASRQEREQLLDEMVSVTGLHRKSLIRLMKGDLQRRPRSQERGALYGPEVTSALAVIWESLDYVCAERLTPKLVEMAQHLEACGELVTTPELLEQLGRISLSPWNVG